jgi:alpha-beta hydrolase superfamily lysophospholipase
LVAADSEPRRAGLRRASLRLSLVVAVALVVAFGWITRSEAIDLVTNPRESRRTSTVTPASRGLTAEDVTVTTRDGLTLHGWYLPAGGPATVMLVHGYKDTRASLLGVAAILQRHGYRVLVTSLRGHDTNDGELVSFGLREMEDVDAFFQYLSNRAGVDRSRIGLFGVSMGGTIGIGYTARNPEIRALVSDCAFSSVSDTVATSVRFFTGLPAFPFAPAIVFWSERAVGGDISDIDAKQWIRRIAPRPVFLLQGGADRVVSPESGARLFEAAGEPKELWLDPALGHAQFLKERPAEFETRITAFFDRTLR